MEDVVKWLALAHIPGLGRQTLEKLLDVFGSADGILQASETDLALIPRIAPAVVAGIRIGDLRTAEREWETMDKVGVRFFHCRHPEYPKLLRIVPDGPAFLWLKGSLQTEDENAVAIVGSTNPSETGWELARAFGAKLAQEGLVIVSGLARGIDTAGHVGALEAGGRTLAVLGCGLRRIFPPENLSLARRIWDAGALLSELPLDVPASGKRLMARNRITSGLAKATIVVESQTDSGSLATAARAWKQGRLVFAVDNGLTGNTELLRQGAEPLPRRVEMGCQALAERIRAFTPSVPASSSGQLSLDFE